ncbi:SNF2 family N-terminal domain-containing protein [Irpex rosettiformis]|uniref:SNF2 family N-terminal domain-containing protein n=1 Tax=Irpex rosettiformis TaxID=378272 RepID=A0ACB8UJS5_9APHY|nr:SNF2 family N-terminal domain-containing protein [Irpex rosettiformis]
MAGDSSDVHSLFSSPGASGSRVTRDETIEKPPLSRKVSAESSLLTSLTSIEEKSFYIELRTLSKAERSRYVTGLSERPISNEEAFPEDTMETIVGELTEGKEDYYYVRLVTGEVFRFPADDFAVQHPDIVTSYETKKKYVELEPFDPSASYVHPSSRARNMGGRDSSIAPGDAEVDEFALDDESSESDEELDELDEDSDSPIKIRRSSRTAATRGGMKQLTLPFSPKKTRAKTAPDRSAVLLDDSDDEDLLAWSMSPPPRRSTRSKTSARRNLDDADFVELAEDSDAYDETPKSKKKVRRNKASRPAYGRFRDISSIDYDSDEDTAALRAHRGDCAKCNGLPAHIQLAQLRKRKPKKRRPRHEDDEFDDDDDDETRARKLGGWVRCLRCPVVAHWGCLARVQRDEILKAANEKARVEWEASKPEDDDEEEMARYKARAPTKKTTLDVEETTEFICGSCMRGGICYCCKEVAIKPDGVVPATVQSAKEGFLQPPIDGDIEMKDGASQSVADGEERKEKDNIDVLDELLFRCSLCKRMAHYSHLPAPPEAPDMTNDAVALAEYYQYTTGWQCADCRSYVYSVESILAWRPFPENAVEKKLPPGVAPNYKDALPREYLVKWIGRSYRRVQWVPHMWLSATTSAKLKNFLEHGSAIALLPEPVSDANAEGGQVDEPVSTFGVGAEEAAEGFEGVFGNALQSGSPDAVPDAEMKIQPAWKTVDRILDVLLWRPGKRFNKKKSRESDFSKEQAEMEKEAAFDVGEQPSNDLVETVDEYCRRTKKPFTEADIDRVVWGFFKWKDLGYDNATWDSPPRAGTPAYDAFGSSLRRFINARKVTVRLLPKAEAEAFEKLPYNHFRKKYAFTHESQPQLGQDDQYKLMPFQVDGVNWLCNNWWNRQHCILADEMGLGKTVQIVTFIGQIVKGFAEGYSACPVLVVVPNSTITNWVREFERWAPNLRVVPFYGDSKSREIIKQYELYHPTVAKHTTGAKYHVLVTTYETVTSARDSSSVFKHAPRWEALVVDEGQRLKSDSSLLFKKLKELNVVHRIILTGTPLNNNIRELFNLMNFLDPIEWDDLNTLEKEYEELTEEKIKELHTRLRPYFLRRIKSEVLQLPPKNEVIVPISMTPLQKETYKSILSQNFKALQSIASAVGAKVNSAASKTNMNNILMQLRKCLQHPYLTAPDMEPTGLSLLETHEKLVSASAKLMMLRMLLPKLKARGHRVLLFSQFVIVLDIIEDYLRGEGFNFLRLDGNTKQSARQKDMDLFNKPDSDVFIYILSTRAGGVGINLWSADTVIIFDPDFNPHQDLQAIARAHRFGQQKTCLVFKFMMKDSAEERIMQTGKKKLVLDHLIVQNMDEEESDVQTIMTFGAQALFEEDSGSARDIHYSDHDIDKLIEKTETEGDQLEPQAGEGAAFSFAKIWSADKDELEELETDNAEKEAQDDAWAKTLQRIAEERAKEQLVEISGRGARRKAAPVFPQQYVFDDSPSKPKKGKGKGKAKAVPQSDEEAYAASEIESSGSSSLSVEGALFADIATLQDGKEPSPERIILYPARPPSPVAEDLPCGLCGLYHSDRPCYMTESSENLAEYRNILMNHAGEESLEDRRAAIAVIDETLHKRGKMSLIFGQPLHPVQNIRRSIPQTTNGHISNPSSFVTTDGILARARPRPKAPPIPRSTPIAGSSKRPASPPIGSGPPLKKVKENNATACVLCAQIPAHALKSCPLVKLGTRSIASEIQRLKTDPTRASVVEELVRLHSKHSKRERLASVLPQPQS